MIDYQQQGNASAYQITPLLLIAFVENAFKHGVKGTADPAYIQISADVTAGKFVFRVENSVRAKRTVVEVEKKSGGIGLDNVRRRLDILYNGQYELVTHATENIYRVTLMAKLDS